MAKERKQKTASKTRLWECSGTYRNKERDDNPLTVRVKAPNENVARVKATEHLHVIDSVNEVTNDGQ